MATCAGTILLAKEGDEQVKKTNTLLLGLLEIKVLRNAYGRQIDSFEADVKLPEIGKKPPELTSDSRIHNYFLKTIFEY